MVSRRVHLLASWGRFVHRHRIPVLVASLMLLAVSAYALAGGGVLTNEQPGDTEAGRTFDLLGEELPDEKGSSFLLVFSHPTWRVDDARFRTAMEDALRPLAEEDVVTAVRTPYGDAPDRGDLVGTSGRTALAVVQLDAAFEDAVRDFERYRGRVMSDDLTVHAMGDVAVTADFNHILEEDLKRAEVVSLPGTLLLLVLVFGTLVAALLPLGVGVFTVVGGLGAVFFLARHMDVSQYALNITTLIGLGVAIDYSLFFVDRFREEWHRLGDVEEAIARAAATAGRAIVFSGLTVAIGLGGLLFYPGTFLASMGLAGTVVVTFAVVYALTALPATLSLLGPRVERGRILRRTGGRREGRFWRGVAIAVMRRPVPILAVSLGAILLAGAPFLGIHLAGGDIDMLPAHAETRQGRDIIEEEFPVFVANRVLVVAHFEEGAVLTRDRVGWIHDLSRELAAHEAVLEVQSVVDLDAAMTRADYQAALTTPPEMLPPPVAAAVERTVGRHVVLLTVLTHEPVASDEARDLVAHARSLTIPGGTVLVTGSTAWDVDAIDFILDRSPLAVGFVVATTFILLTLLVGSIVLPAKAILMNFLSIMASFGALVWIFQEGHLSGVLGFTPAPIDPTLPVIMFCIVFGLSMDYEVMMLSRMHEAYLEGKDNTTAVAHGLQHTGRLITGAAAIMAMVFGSFALAEVTIIKAIGLGLAIAIIIDATLVRALIVPSTMRLMGRLNWWAPRWLRRLHIGR